MTIICSAFHIKSFHYVSIRAFLKHIHYIRESILIEGIRRIIIFLINQLSFCSGISFGLNVKYIRVHVK